MGTKEYYLSPDITNWVIGAGIYLILGLVCAISVYITHRNSERRPKLLHFYIITFLWLIYVIILVFVSIRQKMKSKKTYSVEDIENELIEDERFEFERGVYHQVTQSCKYCKSEIDIDYDVIVVYDEDGNEKFPIAFWECASCRESHIVD
ncbi:hypothetical protein [Bacillus pseudomycoides]|uniref:hypothetical protein n=1 Tax=Bacillus pseudomycoides TaxID=64104 RepID=UPI000BEB5C7E|nr:hypothetical protein [Bacillus pseudomycoides]PEE36584.1 hypothetical protein COO02_25885 [Bacillus pseudomycoides]PGA79863.1 hypothetical protein COL91_28010 [Bacillus pseudomycoides]PHF34653.1 hypothetical protein COF72_27255 [Bacillus pseudomycoides]